MRLIDADALCEEFRMRQKAALNWKEGAILAHDEEIIIRADATLAFLTEVKLTIDNAPTVEYPESITIKCDTEEDKQKLLSALRNASARLEVRVEEDKPIGKWTEHYDSTDGFTWLTCSRCMFKAHEDDYNFCPNCGAEMRKEVNND